MLSVFNASLIMYSCHCTAVSFRGIVMLLFVVHDKCLVTVKVTVLIVMIESYTATQIRPHAHRLRNDLYCVEWDVKLYYTIPCKYFLPVIAGT